MKKINPKLIVVIIIIFSGLVLLFSSFYTVDKDERAVVTRFGRHIRTASPGLNLKLPWIDQAMKIPVLRVLTEEFGFVPTKPGVKSQIYRGTEQIREAQMLTGDLKVIQIEWIVQYKITDPKNYLFNVRDPRNSLRVFSVIAMSKIVGDYLFDEIITIAKSDITNKMQDVLQNTIDKVNMGISIQTVELNNVTPPAEVEASYNEVLQAQQEKDRIVNEAKQEYNKKVIPVEGKKERMIAEAKGYKAERVKVALGEAKYFNSLYREYIKAPEVTKKRIYLETMSEVLPKLNDIYIVDEKQRNLVPLMQMGFKNITEKKKGE